MKKKKIKLEKLGMEYMSLQSMKSITGGGSVSTSESKSSTITFSAESEISSESESYTES